MVHHRVFADSAGNHAFPMVALHGALWAAGFFETTGRLGHALRARYFYDARERELWMILPATGNRSSNPRHACSRIPVP